MKKIEEINTIIKNKRCLSTIKVKIDSKIHIKLCFSKNKKTLIILAYLNKRNPIKKINYFPMQKSLKILPKISSTSTFPTIIPR